MRRANPQSETIMKKQEKRPFKITVILSGRTNQIENQNDDGTYTFNPCGNAKTTEQSAIASVKRNCVLCGCKVEKIIKIEK